MTKPNFGMRDMSRPAFWFSVSYGEDLQYGSLQIINTERFSKMIIDANIDNLDQLKNHPCQVEVTDKGYVEFVKILDKGLLK